MRAVTATQQLYWRNPRSHYPVLSVELDPTWLITAGSRPSLRDFAPAFLDRLPGLPADAFDHGQAHFLAALCWTIHHDRYGGPTVYGPVSGSAGFWFSSRDIVHARVVAGETPAFLDRIAAKPPKDRRAFAAEVDRLVDRTESVAFDQTMRAFLSEADRRGIPWRRLDANFRTARFGHGHRQYWQMESLIGTDSGLGQRLTRDKAASFRIFSDVGLPVGRFAMATTPEQAMQLAGAVGFPLVAKPNTGGKGKLVFVGLQSAAEIRRSAEQILSTGVAVLLQSMIPGDDHRLLVVDGKLVAAARRNAASVVGDGVKTVEELVWEENTNPDRGPGFRKLMNLIVIEEEVERVLAGQGLRLNSVPPAGARVMLRLTANIHTGGTATDFTETIHPDNRRLAERAARAVGLKVAGVDFLTTDITRSWREIGGGICEVNTTVGLRPHWLANRNQNVVAPIMDLIYPVNDRGRIATALVTGSNGKTTTTRMIGAILAAAGHHVGMATTDGVQVDGEWLMRGDCASVPGAALTLQEPTVTAAALETARGGILKRGVYVEECTAAALLNIQQEQVGIDGIDTLDQMAALKRKVIETAREGVVLNAADEHCLAMAADFPAARTILFALDGALPALSGHVARGGRVVTTVEIGGASTLVMRDAAGDAPVIAADAIPATLGGIVRHNIQNALAAVGLAWAMGIGRDHMAAALSAFRANLATSPGRFNILDEYPVRVLLDFANNPPALRETLASLDKIAAGRKIIVFANPGNRPDHQIREYGSTVAGHGDIYVCMDREDRRRGRREGEIVGLLAAGLASAGVAPNAVHLSTSQKDALAQGVALASRPDDLLVVLYTEVPVSKPQLDELFAARATVGTVEALKAVG